MSEMGIETTITCDNPKCGRDLRTTRYSLEYRLRLEAVAMGHESKSRFAMGLEAPIQEPMVFCDLGCLRERLCAASEVR